MVTVFLIQGQRGYLVLLCCTVSGHNGTLFETQKNTEALLKGRAALATCTMIQQRVMKMLISHAEFINDKVLTQYGNRFASVLFVFSSDQQSVLMCNSYIQNTKKDL